MLASQEALVFHLPHPAYLPAPVLRSTPQELNSTISVEARGDTCSSVVAMYAGECLITLEQMCDIPVVVN